MAGRVSRRAQPWWSSIGFQQFPAIGPATVPASGNTTLCTLITEHMERLWVEIANATQAFDAFAIQARFHEDGSFVSLFDAAGDFTSPAGILIGASGDLTTLAAGSSGWFCLDVLGIQAVRLVASAAVNNAAPTIYAAGA